MCVSVCVFMCVCVCVCVCPGLVAAGSVHSTWLPVSVVCVVRETAGEEKDALWLSRGFSVGWDGGGVYEGGGEGEDGECWC